MYSDLQKVTLRNAVRIHLFYAIIVPTSLAKLIPLPRFSLELWIAGNKQYLVSVVDHLRRLYNSAIQLKFNINHNFLQNLQILLGHCPANQ